MRYRGPLGGPRLTKFGPFTVEDKAAELTSKAIDEIADKVVKENDLPEDGYTDEEAETFITECADIMYDASAYTQPVERAKRVRFAKCMKNRWAEAWVEGVEESGAKINTDRDRLTMMAKGCYGMVESETSNHAELVPKVYKNLPVLSD